MGRTESEFQASKRSSDLKKALLNHPDDEVKSSNATARLEAEMIRKSIRKRLRDKYTLANRPQYHHFGLSAPVDGSALDDTTNTLCSTKCKLAVDQYLEAPLVREEMDEVGRWVAADKMPTPAERSLETWRG